MNKKEMKIKKVGGFLKGIFQFILVNALAFAGLLSLQQYFSTQKKGGFFAVLIYTIFFIIFCIIMSKMKKRIRRERLSMFDDGWIQYLISEKLIALVVPCLIYVIVYCILTAKNTATFPSIGTILLSILIVFWGSYLYDNALRLFLFDTIYVKYRVKGKGFLLLSVFTVLSSVAFLLGLLYLAYGCLPSASFLLYLIIMETYCQIAYVRGGWIYETALSLAQSFRNRANLSLILFLPLLLQKNEELNSFNIPNFILYAGGIPTLICLIVFLAQLVSLDNKCYEAVDKWGIPEEELFTAKELEHVDNKVSTRRLRFNDDAKISRYVILSLVAGAAVFAVHYGVHYLLPTFNCQIEFVKEEGAELLSTMISSIFLIVSFLSFLGDRDDKILWTDMRTFRLVNPTIMNFIGLAVFSFASLIGTAFCLVLHYHILFILMFVLGLFFQTYLTFLVIVSYFRREETIRMLKNYSISTLCGANYGTSWDDIWDGIYENSMKLAEDKAWTKFQENFDFLVSLYACARNIELKRDFDTKHKVICKMQFDIHTELMNVLLKKAERTYGPNEYTTTKIMERVEQCISMLYNIMDDENIRRRLIRRNQQSLFIPSIQANVPGEWKKSIEKVKQEDLNVIEKIHEATFSFSKTQLVLQLSIGELTLNLRGFNRKTEDMDANSAKIYKSLSGNLSLAEEYLKKTCLNEYHPIQDKQTI